MTDAQKALLESVLTAQVLLLARDMEAKDRAHGVHSGGYLKQAAAAIGKARPEVLALLLAQAPARPGA